MSKLDKLTDKQKLLVDTIVADGCSIKEAAKKAGYSSNGSEEAGRITASRTLRLPKVQQYMTSRIADTLGLGAVSASRKLIELSGNARSEYVQLEASRDILDRVGMRVPDKVKHTIEGDIKINIDLS
jgi:phage terminase small subunit